MGTKIFAEFAKVEDQDDGTLKVFGYASSGAVDSDGEIITPDAMKAALPGYMKWGAVREMHQPKAAGTALSANVLDDGRTEFGALIVDSEAVKKVKAGVYKGFSIGGRVTDRDAKNASTITGINLVEVSLVDRPANPEAVFTMYKADGIDKRDKASVLADLKKYAGDEAWDAAAAIDALLTIQDLLYWESQEDEKNADQIKALTAAVARIKEFIASEIAEDNSKAATPEDLAKRLEALLAKHEPASADAAKLTGELKATRSELEKARKQIDDLAAERDKYAAQAGELETAKAEATRQGEALAKMTAERADAAKLTGELGAAKAALAKRDAELAENATELQKRADEIKALTTERSELTAKVSALEALPRADNMRLRSVSKGQDVGTKDASHIEPVRDDFGKVNDTATLIKAAQQRPAPYGA